MAIDITALQQASKQTARHPIAKVTMTWAGSSVDNATVSVDSQFKNRASLEGQIAYGIGNSRKWAYCDTESGLSGQPMAILDDDDPIYAMPDDENLSQGNLVGWYGNGNNLSDVNCEFATPQPVTITWVASPMQDINVRGDKAYGEYPVDFNCTLLVGPIGSQTTATYSNGTQAIVYITGNTSVAATAHFSEIIPDCTGVLLQITKWSAPGAFVKIQSMASALQGEYDLDDIMSISLLEEVDGVVGKLPIGGVSANELSLTLQNIDNKFTLGNTASPLSTVARANRRINPSIGFSINGEDTYLPRGAYWTNDWTVDVYGEAASTTAKDRLGLLQDIEYFGIGNIFQAERKPETYTWINRSLYDIATDLLNDLRNNVMIDLAFDIDIGLQQDIIEVGFFKGQSYFDCIKNIVGAGYAVAYMDTPTEDEKTAQAELGNTDCADILRIKKIYNMYPTLEDGITETYEITLDDLEGQTYSAQRSMIANAVSVPFSPYVVDEESGEARPQVDSETQRVVLVNEQSMREYGRLEFSLDENQLIQTEAQARAIATNIIQAYSGSQREMELQGFGDVTLSVGNIIQIPEYQKHSLRFPPPKYGRSVHVSVKLQPVLNSRRDICPKSSKNHRPGQL